MRAIFGAVALAFVVSPALADPLLDRTLEEGTVAAATEAGVRWSRATDPQALASGLVKTGLLETMNRYAVTPKGSDGTLELAAFARLGAIAANGRRYAFAADGDRVTAVLVRIPVPVASDRDSGEGWKPERLYRRRAALAELSRYRLAAVERDEHGNAFVWKGRSALGAVFVRYVPQDDELVILAVR